MKVLKIISPLATSALLALAFPSASVWPLAFVALVPLLLWVEGKDYRHAFFGGVLAGFVFYAIVFAWFATLTYWVGGIVLLGVAVLFLFFALFWGAIMAACVFISRKFAAGAIIALPSMWVLMEYAHNHIFTGFGWGSVGYTQWNNLPVAQLASIGSVYAVSFYIVTINVLIVALIRRVRQPALASAAAIAIVALGIAVPAWGITRMRPPDMSSSLRIGLVQPNFSLDVKWSGEYAGHMLETLARQTELAAANGAELVVWPESAFYGYLVDEMDEIARIVKPHGVYLLTGSQHYESAGPDTGDLIYYNSAFLIDPDGRNLGRYDKRHLAPFGEYVPFAKMFPFLGKVVPAVADFASGKKAVAPFNVKGKTFCVLICFENSFPHLVRKTAALDADFLVQLTNDGWFGRSSQPEQDNAIAVFRAIENGVTLVRGTNTGVSCFVDPWGRISGVVSSNYGETVFAQGISVETISTVAHDTWYKTHGDIWVLGCLALFAAALGPAVYRSRKGLPEVDEKLQEETGQEPERKSENE